jgi:amidase
MARTVTDAAVLLGALTGIDIRDVATDASDGRALPDYTRALDEGALRGARIGVMRRHAEMDRALGALFTESINLMRDAGAHVVENIEIPSIEELPYVQSVVLLCEFKDAIREYLRHRGPDERHRTLADLIRFNRENADMEMQWFGQESFEAADATDGRQSIEYRAALARSRMLSRSMGLDRVLGEGSLDAIVGVAASPPFAVDLLSGDRSIVRNSSLSAVAGYPRVTVPAGFIHNLPVGVSFMGTAWSEARLLSLAYAFEQASDVRQPPHFLPTAVVDK